MSTPDNPYGSAGQPYGSNDPQNTGAANGGYQAGQQNYGQEFGQGSSGPEYSQATSGQQGYGQQDFGQPSAQPAGTGYPSYPGVENTSGSYGAGGYPSAPAYGGVEIQERNTLAPWALVLSIAAIVFAISIIGLIIAWLPALVGLILSIIAILRAKKIQGPYRRMGMSVASLIISGLTTALFVIGIIGFSILMANSGEAIQKCQNDYPTNSSAQQQCINDAVQDALGG